MGWQEIAFVLMCMAVLAILVWAVVLVWRINNRTKPASSSSSSSPGGSTPTSSSSSGGCAW